MVARGGTGMEMDCRKLRWPEVEDVRRDGVRLVFFEPVDDDVEYMGLAELGVSPAEGLGRCRALWGEPTVPGWERDGRWEYWLRVGGVVAVVSAYRGSAVHILVDHLIPRGKRKQVVRWLRERLLTVVPVPAAVVVDVAGVGLLEETFLPPREVRVRRIRREGVRA
jgi:hypothetical protein